MKYRDRDICLKRVLRRALQRRKQGSPEKGHMAQVCGTRSDFLEEIMSITAKLLRC